MPVVDTFFTIKKDFPEDLLMFKSGSFYHSYQNDAMLLSSIFNWRLKSGKITNECGFPLSSLGKVEAKLNELKVNYKVIDPRNNYQEDEKVNFKNLNNYKNELFKAQKIVDNRKDVKKISDILYMYVGTEKFKPIIKKIGELLDENR